MANWIREYRFSAGQAGSAGFGINELHINFSVEKSDVSSPNTAKISLWNLSPAHKAALEKKGLCCYAQCRLQGKCSDGTYRNRNQCCDRR